MRPAEPHGTGGRVERTDKGLDLRVGSDSATFNLDKGSASGSSY